MNAFKLAALGVFGIVAQAHATPMVTYSSFLPPVGDIYAPTPSYSISGPIAPYGVAPMAGDASNTTYVGLTQSYPGIARSPFETAPAAYASAPYTSVSGGGDVCFGFCYGLVPEVTAAFRPAVFTQPAFVGGDSFSFIYGSPDTYNTLTIYDSSFTPYTLTGAQIAPTTQLGYQYVTITGLDGIYGVEFASSSNAFEFAAVSAVPLPASLPMFGAAILGLGVVGFGVKRRKTAASA